MTIAERVVRAILDDDSQLELPLNDLVLPDVSDVADTAIDKWQRERQNGKIVYEYDVHDHGVMDCQYWQGAGTSHTKWDEVGVGSGENPHAAMEEALEDLSQQGWDTSTIHNEFDPDAGDVVAKVVADAWPDAVDAEGDVDTGDSYNYVTVYVRGVPGRGEE